MVAHCVLFCSVQGHGRICCLFFFMCGHMVAHCGLLCRVQGHGRTSGLLFFMRGHCCWPGSLLLADVEGCDINRSARLFAGYREEACECQANEAKRTIYAKS